MRRLLLIAFFFVLLVKADDGSSSSPTTTSSSSSKNITVASKSPTFSSSKPSKMPALSPYNAATEAPVSTNQLDPNDKAFLHVTITVSGNFQTLGATFQTAEFQNEFLTLMDDQVEVVDITDAYLYNYGSTPSNRRVLSPSLSSSLQYPLDQPYIVIEARMTTTVAQAKAAQNFVLSAFPATILLGGLTVNTVESSLFFTMFDEDVSVSLMTGGALCSAPIPMNNFSCQGIQVELDETRTALYAVAAIACLFLLIVVITVFRVFVFSGRVYRGTRSDSLTTLAPLLQGRITTPKSLFGGNNTANNTPSNRSSKRLSAQNLVVLGAGSEIISNRELFDLVMVVLGRLMPDGTNLMPVPEFSEQELEAALKEWRRRKAIWQRRSYHGETVINVTSLPNPALNVPGSRTSGRIPSAKLNKSEADKLHSLDNLNPFVFPPPSNEANRDSKRIEKVIVTTSEPITSAARSSPEKNSPQRPVSTNDVVITIPLDAFDDGDDNVILLGDSNKSPLRESVYHKRDSSKRCGIRITEHISPKHSTMSPVKTVSAPSPSTLDLNASTNMQSPVQREERQDPEPAVKKRRNDEEDEMTPSAKSLLEEARDELSPLKSAPKYHTIVEERSIPLQKAEQPSPKPSYPEQIRVEQPRMEPPKVEQPSPKPYPEQPKVEPPRAEQPRVEKPKAEQPSSKPYPEQTRVEPPRMEQSRVEQPRIEQLRAEQPKVEPRYEQPRGEHQPRMEQSWVVEQPKVLKVEQPKAEQQARMEQSRMDQPRMEQPRVVEQPKIEQTREEESATDQASVNLGPSRGPIISFRTMMIKKIAQEAAEKVGARNQHIDRNEKVEVTTEEATEDGNVPANHNLSRPIIPLNSRRLPSSRRLSLEDVSVDF